MRVTSPFLHRYRSAGRPPVQLERVLAVGRSFLTVSALVAIYLDPTEPARLRAITYGVLFAYALYSLGVLVYVHRSVRLTRGHGQLLHGLDIAWTSALTFVSEGPVSPFFLFFLFVVVAAAYRGGFRETAGTAVIVAAVLLVETAIAATGPWNNTWLATIGFELNRTILRVAYLLLTGVLLGYLAEQEKQSRAELAAIADASRQPRVDLGLGGSVAAVARLLLTTFGARTVAVVIDDHDRERSLLWHLDETTHGAESPVVRRVELTPEERPIWLFQDFGPAWRAVPDPAPATSAEVQAIDPGRWPLKRLHADLPAGLSERPFKTVTAVNMGLPGEWHGRIYFFDASQIVNPERSLHFLEALSEHTTPALTNVFLLRRLRARAGAAERARVARELHDGAIQALFGIDMKLEAFRRSADRSPSFIDREVGEVQGLVRNEVLALRELMQALRPIDLEGTEQIPEVLAGLVERFRRDTGISARFLATGSRVTIDPKRAPEIIRIVQEALVNVRRHSQATNVLVSLSSQGGTCRLVVEDDGCGFEFSGCLSAEELDARRIGPAVIKERARLAGAQLTVESTPGAGARLELSFNETSDHG